MHTYRRWLAGAAGLAAAAGLAVIATPALADPVPADAQSQTTAAPDINVDNVLGHLEQFQSIADANGGNRSAGSAGYAASADYVEGKLTEAGYDVHRQTCSSCSGDDNLIADWPGGDESATLMLGAHLDGVPAGPGSNDNGSGSAAILEVALNLAEANPELTKHVRFGWWASEETGLNGSAFYAQSGEADGVEAYLNFDMVGSPNAGYFVDGLDTAYGKAFSDYLASVDKAPDQMSECCSDDLSFQDIGVPTAFLSTGASDTMTAEQAAKWGGTEGEAFDECYHSACDTYPDNINSEALDISADAIAYVLWDAAVG